MFSKLGLVGLPGELDIVYTSYQTHTVGNKYKSMDFPAVCPLCIPVVLHPSHPLLWALTFRVDFLIHLSSLCYCGLWLSELIQTRLSLPPRTFKNSFIHKMKGHNL